MDNEPRFVKEVVDGQGDGRGESGVAYLAGRILKRAACAANGPGSRSSDVAVAGEAMAFDRDARSRLKAHIDCMVTQLSWIPLLGRTRHHRHGLNSGIRFLRIV